MMFNNSKLNSLLLLVMLAFTASACGEDSAKKPESETPTYKPPEVQRAEQAPAQVTNERAHPVTDETRQTYQWYCAQCHGIKGKGDGINAKFLPVPPRDHTKADYLETRTDEHLFTAIQQGGLSVGRAPCMPRWGRTLDDDTIHSLVSYIRELCDCEAM